MLVLLLLALKSLLIAGGTLVLLRLMQHRSAAERGTMAHLGLLALVLLPLASLVLPSLSLPVFWWDDASVTAQGIMTAASPMEGRASPAPMLQADGTVQAATVLAAVLYLAPAFALVISTIAALGRLIGLRGRAEVLVDAVWLHALARAQRRLGFKGGTALLASDDLDSPVSWGLMRPTILLNVASVRAPEQAEAVIAHELAHVLHFDWLKLIVARLAIAIFWFNPFAWILGREAHQLREELADDAVLDAKVAGPDYAALLIGMARTQNRRSAGAFHRIAAPRNSLRRRIERVLDSDRVRARSGMTWVAGYAIAMLGLATPLAALTLKPVSKPTPFPRPIATFASRAVTPPDRANPVRDVRVSAAPSPIQDAAPASDTRAGMLSQSGGRPVRMAVAPTAPARGETIDADLLVQMTAAGVTPAFARAMADAGFPGLSVNQLVGLHSFGITPDYARAMLAVGMPATWNDLCTARSLGVEPRYIEAMHGLGIDGAYSEFRTLWTFRITPENVRRIRARGIIVTSAHQLLDLHAVGADQEA